MAPSVNEQYIVDEKGNPTAVILPIKEYKKMLLVLEEVEDHRETKILSQSAEFKKLVKRGLEDIKAGRTKPWKEVWDDL
jgi:PHD/YefM family antitoxin component YafN of YafNO toxin-antitoxin module